MNQVGLPHTAVATLNLPLFDGYPYIVVRLQPAFYHLSAVPTGRPLSALRELARCQAQMNDLQVCLALAPDFCFFYEPVGTENESVATPRGGVVVSGILKCAEEFPPTPELIQRQMRLEAFAKNLEQKGYAFGDLTKGGHKPDELEAERLGGRQPGGIPRGLSRCAKCSEWRGECIDPNPLIGGLVVRAHCFCENRNFCARCGERLCDRKVNANYYSEQDGTIWHVPGFSALRHRCEGGPKWQG